MRAICNHYFPAPLTGQSWGIYMCVCVYLCTYTAQALISQMLDFPQRMYMSFSMCSDSDSLLQANLSQACPPYLVWVLTPCSRTPHVQITSLLWSLTAHTGLCQPMHVCPPHIAWSLTFHASLPCGFPSPLHSVPDYTCLPSLLFGCPPD